MEETKRITFPQMYNRRQLNDLYRQVPLRDTTSRLLRKYFNAFANLYGIIPIWKAYEIIHSQCPRLINEKEFYAFVEIAQHECEDYFILGEEELYVDGKKTPFSQYEIINRILLMGNVGEDAEEDEDAYILIKEMQAGKPYYIPDKQELLLYADAVYYEETVELEAIRQFFIGTLKMEEADTYFALEDLCFQTRYIESREETRLPELIAIDYKKFRKNDLDTFANLYIQFSNNSRMQCNRGYTPEEMVSMYPPEARRLESFTLGPNIQKILANGEWDREELKEMLRSAGVPVDGLEAMSGGDENEKTVPIVPLPVKAGRNDLCPCGSGKKYKNCCGKNP